MKERLGEWQLMPLHQYLSVTSESSGLHQSHSKSVYSVTILTLPSQPQHSANLHSLTPTPKPSMVPAIVASLTAAMAMKGSHRGSTSPQQFGGGVEWEWESKEQSKDLLNHKRLGSS